MMQTLMEIILTCVAVAGIASISLATIYDMKTIRTAVALRQDMRRMSKRRQPHVSIIITHIESSKQLQRCLRNIGNSRYEQYNIVAVKTNISTRERHRLQSLTTIKHFRIYSPRREMNSQSVLVNAYQRSLRGDMILVLQAQDLIDPSIITKSVAILQRDASIGGVRLTGEIDEPRSLLQVYSIFSELGERLTSKAWSVLGLSQRQGNVATGLYHRKSIIRAKKGSASSMRVAYLKGLESKMINRNESWQWTQWVSRLLFLAVFLYSSTVAASLQSTWPFMMTWIIVCIWLAAVVWSDDATRLKRKLVISFCIPIGMFLMVASYIVGGVANIFRLKTF